MCVCIICYTRKVLEVYCGFGDKSVGDSYSALGLHSTASLAESILCCNCIKFCVDAVPSHLDVQNSKGPVASPEFKRPRPSRQVGR
jgi:hypothetical protein